MAEQELELKEVLIKSKESNTKTSEPTNNTPKHEDLLLKALINNNIKALGKNLKKATQNDFTRKREYTFLNAKKPVFRNIVTIACADSRISANIFAVLYSHCDDFDLTEEGWYYWQPIHFAAFSGNSAKLKIVLDANRQTNNNLSLFSENALHVLLEYGRRNRIFNVQLTNAWESRICTIIPTEKNDILDCARLLIEAGVDINHNNLWNETPLIIAIKYRLLGIIKLILDTRRAELDACRDSFTGKSARDLLREDEMCLDMLTPNVMPVGAVKALFTSLKMGDEESFLRYNNENIGQYVNELDGQYGNNMEGTMLHLCLIKGFVDYEKQKDIFQEAEEVDIFKTRLLNFFCQKGFGRCAIHLLNNGAQISESLLRMAMKLNYYPFLVILLQHKNAKIIDQKILNILIQVTQTLSSIRNPNTKHVLFLLIQKLEIIFEPTELSDVSMERRVVLNHVLDLYLQNQDIDDEYKNNICQVLRMGATLVSDPTNKVDCKRLEAISPNTLCNHLNDCMINSRGICFDSLMQDVDSHDLETEVLHYLTQDPAKIEMLGHPALLCLIHAKWKKVKLFFYLNIIFYLIYLVILYFYMIQLHTKTANVYLLKAFLVCLFILLLKELSQFILHSSRYFYDPSNYLELFIIGCCFTNIFTGGEISMILSILLSTLSFLLVLGQMPKYSKYMIIFSSTRYFLEYALFYFLQFFAFALCFFILLPPADNLDSNVFGRIMVQLFETLIFFLGQYEGDITNPPNFPIFGRIIVAIFIFCMTIILNNLLVGLIVTDMDLIHKTSKQLGQVKMVKSIRKIEKFLSKLEKIPYTEVILNVIGSTKVFKLRKPKILGKISDFEYIFDDREKEHLKEILRNRMRKSNILENLYKHVISQIYNNNKTAQDNSDILFKQSRIGEQF